MAVPQQKASPVVRQGSSRARQRLRRPNRAAGAASHAPALQITAFRNTDGGRVVEILNTATTATTARLDIGSGGRPDTYLTDNTHSLAPTSAASVRGGRLSVDLPARSLTTVVLDR